MNCAVLSTRMMWIPCYSYANNRHSQSDLLVMIKRTTQEDSQNDRRLRCEAEIHLQPFGEEWLWHVATSSVILLAMNYKFKKPVRLAVDLLVFLHYLVILSTASPTALPCSRYRPLAPKRHSKNPRSCNSSQSRPAVRRPRRWVPQTFFFLEPQPFFVSEEDGKSLENQ